MVHSAYFFCGIFLFLYLSLLKFWVKTCYRFIPFSGGPRKCVGDQFALMEAIVALAIFLQHMNFELVPDQNISMTTGATIHTTNVRLYNFFFVIGFLQVTCLYVLQLCLQEGFFFFFFFSISKTKYIYYKGKMDRHQCLQECDETKRKCQGSIYFEKMFSISISCFDF